MVRSPCTLLSADGADARARLADVAAEHQEVHDLADGGDAVFVLGHAHRPADDGALASQDPLVDLLDLLPGQPGGGQDVAPGDRAGVRGELLEAGAVSVDPGVVEHGAGRGVLGLEQQLVESLEQGEVAARANVDELVGDRGAAADDTPSLLRMLEAHQACLGQGVDGDDLAAVALGLLQRGEHAGMVGARVLSDHEDQVAVVDVVERDAALTDAQGFAESPSAGFVAQVGAVRQVVGAVYAREQLQEEGGLVVEPAGDVEQGFVGGVQCPQLVGEQAQGLVPADRLVVGRARTLDHRFGEAALLVEPVVRLAVQFIDRVLAEEAGGDPARGGLVVDVLGAVLAVLVDVPLARPGLRPRTARAIEPLRLVDVQQRQCGPAYRRLGQGVLKRVGHGGDTGRPGLWRGDGEVVARVLVGAHRRKCPVLPSRVSLQGWGRAYSRSTSRGWRSARSR
jgi:hypothetical protein